MPRTKSLMIAIMARKLVRQPRPAVGRQKVERILPMGTAKTRSLLKREVIARGAFTSSKICRANSCATFAPIPKPPLPMEIFRCSKENPPMPMNSLRRATSVRSQPFRFNRKAQPSVGNPKELPRRCHRVVRSSPPMQGVEWIVTVAHDSSYLGGS